MMQPGQFIGQYQIVEPLGQGGMATVYKAYHPRLNRSIAIKMIHKAHLEDRGFVARFEREAQIVASLEHPNIVPVYDYAEYEGQPYIVMKLVEGCTLKSALNDGPLQLKDILALMPPLANALDYAHGQGVLHRDIKPSNMILDMKSTPYLTDFGLARLVQAGESTYSQDMLLGTPYYISPEQAMGDKELDRRTDLYSFGVVLYELMVGQVPYSSGTPLSIIHDHIYRPLPSPSLINPEIPPLVEAVLLKALAKDADDRYQSGAEMVTALRESIGKAKLTALNPERRHTVADTLIRVLAQQQEASQRTYKSAVTPTPFPSPKSDLSIGAHRAASSRKPRSPFTIIGFIVVILALVAVIIFMALPTIESSPTPPTQSIEPTAISTQTSAIELYNVPILSPEAAQTALAQNPNEPANYLALALASGSSGDIRNLMNTLVEGSQHTDDPVRYWLTVGTEAVQGGHLTVAFPAYRDALVRAAAGDSYPEVRAFVGEQLYNAAQLPRAVDFRLLQGWFRDQQPDSIPPLLEAMYARVLMANGRPNQNRTEIDRLLRESSALAESHLVQGDLYASASNREQALEEWEAARSQEDAPEWVRERATELIDPS